MKTLFKVLVVILFAYAAVMGLMTLQYFFDRGDLKRASRVIYQYTPSGQDKKLVQVMADEFKVSLDDLYCETALESRYEGHVTVTCGPKTLFLKQPKQNFVWVVDLVASSIRPYNEKAKAMLTQLQKQHPQDPKPKGSS